MTMNKRFFTLMTLVCFGSIGLFAKTAYLLDSIVTTNISNQKTEKIEYKYDNNGNRIWYCYYNWTGNNWSKQMEETYDSKGNIIQKISDNNTYKVEWSYDDKGNQISYKDYNLNGGLWEININQKTEYVYNGVVPTLETQSRWNNNAWRFYIKLEYVYNNQKLTSRIRSDWDNGLSDWVLKYKTDYTYNGNSNLTSEIAYSRNNGNWVKSSEKTYEYDGNGNKISTISDTYQYLYVYSNNYLVSESGYYRTPLRFSYGYEYLYENGNISSRDNYSYYASSPGYILSSTSMYYYSNKSIQNSVKEITDTQFIVYPNPTSDMLYIGTESTIKIYNLQGVLLNESFGSQISLEKLPKGVYLLEINNVWTRIIKN